MGCAAARVRWGWASHRRQLNQPNFVAVGVLLLLLRMRAAAGHGGVDAEEHVEDVLWRQLLRVHRPAAAVRLRAERVRAPLLLPRRPVAVPVVVRALVRVGEELVRLADVLEPPLRQLLLVHVLVRVPPERLSPVGLRRASAWRAVVMPRCGSSVGGGKASARVGAVEQGAPS